MRTQTEIAERFKERSKHDMLGFEVYEYVAYLKYDAANKAGIVKEGVTKEKWDKDILKLTDKKVEKQMKEYMEFAFKKANDCRGISAQRSIMHYTAWLWLLGDDGLLKQFEAIEYQHYGKEKLILLCEHFGWDWKKLDNGIRTNTDEG